MSAFRCVLFKDTQIQLEHFQAVECVASTDVAMMDGKRKSDEATYELLRSGTADLLGILNRKSN